MSINPQPRVKYDDVEGSSMTAAAYRVLRFDHFHRLIEQVRRHDIIVKMGALRDCPAIVLTALNFVFSEFHNVVFRFVF